MRSIDDLRELEKDYSMMQPSGASKDFICNFAEELARDIGFGPGDDIAKVVTDNGGNIHIRDYTQIDDASGTIYIHEKRKSFDIVIPDYTGPLRDRFTIAHELGHYLMHKPVENSWSPRMGIDRIEWEANWFASCFLMPNTKFREAMERGLNISALAAHFGVNPSAIENRLSLVGNNV